MQEGVRAPPIVRNARNCSHGKVSGCLNNASTAGKGSSGSWKGIGMSHQHQECWKRFGKLSKV